MPIKPKHPCNFVGCPNLTNKRFCKEHEKLEIQKYEQSRLSSTQRGYDKTWSRYRKAFLSRNPLCIECEKQGRLTPATDVDHIKPVTGPNDPGFWDEKNLRSLCHECHSRKHAKEGRRWGRANNNDSNVTS